MSESDTDPATARDAFETFSGRLAAEVRASPYTRAELAARIGVQAATIKSWCIGRRSPTVERLLELCTALGVRPASLFEVPAAAEPRVHCPACDRSFRRRVGYRIHVAQRARECDEHRRLLEEEHPGVADRRQAG